MAKKIYSDVEQYGSFTLNNAGGGCILEADTNGSLCTKIAGKQVKFLTQNNYIIGDIFLSTVNTNPSERFGGIWDQISADAYLKIVTSGAGGLGGTSINQTIPTESMPSHKHLFIIGSPGTGEKGGGLGMGAQIGSGNEAIEISGGGQPYYPYYYGIYAWIKRA